MLSYMNKKNILRKIYGGAFMAVDIDFVKITPKANEEVIKLVNAENNPDIGLRLGVKGGGCSGLSYDLQFTPQEKGDTIISHDGFNVFMDASRWHIPKLGEKNNNLELSFFIFFK